MVYGEEYVRAMDLKDIMPGSLEPGLYITHRFDDIIVSMLKRSEGDIYLLARDIGTIHNNFNMMLIKVISIGGVICFVFLLISWLLTRKMLDPVYEFIRKLREVKDFSNREPMKDYFTTYKGHSSVYKKIFVYYLLVFIPVALMIGISFLFCNTIAKTSIHKEYLHIVEKSAGSVESRISSYESYLKYLSLDREFQESVVEANRATTPETEQYLSYVLLKKGVVDRNLNFISIYNAEHESLYSNIPKLFIQPEDFDDVGAYERKESIQLIRNSEGSSSIMAVMRNNIRYLGDIQDKSGFFDDLGYIEIGIKNLIDKDKGFSEKKPVSLSIVDNYKNVHIIGSNANEHNYAYLENLLRQSTVTQMEHHYASMDGVKTMIILYPLKKKDWLLVYFIPIQWEAQEYIMLLLYMIELIFIILIITGTSYYLGKRMTSPIRKAIVFMEEFKEDYSVRLDQNDHDFEFVILAKSFNTMLGRLEQLSTELRE